MVKQIWLLSKPDPLTDTSPVASEVCFASLGTSVFICAGNQNTYFAGLLLRVKGVMMQSS